MRLRLVPTVVALVLMAIGIAAGIWQTGRAEQKLALKARLEALAHEPPKPLATLPFDREALRYHPVEVRGVWLANATIFLDNRTHQGVPGYHVVTPVKLSDGRVVLVNRGWVKALRTRTELPAVTTPAGEITLTGQARVPLQNAFALGALASPDQRVWQQLKIDALSSALKLSLAPFVVFQTSPAEDGLVRAWDAPDYGIDTHKGYAFQWFSLAVLSVVFLLVMSFKGRRDEN
ncbi:MAG: hypothetical protein RIR70_132 [Pseudomonadota bacterium]|jgi:cytochrome oxidase assembly protein ShyY1